ncbi:MAG TPA: hypothetical protein ENN07_06510 [candidate division Zixibacteria bacterium]|nr:hypothetical protein [candidate division Zixibacteria bacterium]
MKIIISLLCAFALVALGQTSPEDFDSASARIAVEAAPEELREQLFETYSGALGNWRQLASFVENFADDKDKLADAIWLVNILPHLDRLLATEEILTEHLEYSSLARELAPWEIPEEMFRPFILAYRLSYEPATAWRKLLYEMFAEAAFEAGSPRSAAQNVNLWISENIDTAGWDYFGGMQPPDFTLRSRRGTESEIASLAVAILKSLGIPSRSASIRAIRGEGGSMSWVEIFDSGEVRWIPMFPSAPERFGDFGYPAELHPDGITVVNVVGGFDYDFNTSSYSPVGTLKAAFTRRGAPADAWQHFSVSVFGDGAYWPLDEIGTRADSTGAFEFELAVGEYLLQSGTRDNSGSVWVQTFPFTVVEGGLVEIEVDVTAPAYLEAQVEIGTFPVFTLTDFSGKPFSHNQIKAKRPSVLAFLDPTAEPSVRAMTALDGLAEQFGDSVRFIDVYFVESVATAQIPETGRLALIDEGGALTMALFDYDETLPLRNEALPAIVFCEGEDLHFETLSVGYNTAIMEIIRDRIELWLAR